MFIWKKYDSFSTYKRALFLDILSPLIVSTPKLSTLLKKGTVLVTRICTSNSYQSGQINFEKNPYGSNFS